MNRPLIAAAALAAMLTLTACGGVEKDASYEDVQALREAVLASDGDCPGETAEGEDGDGEVLIVCDDDTAVRWFPNDEELKTGRIGMAIGLGGADAYLTGSNWIIQGDTDELADLRDSLGGELTVR